MFRAALGTLKSYAKVKMWFRSTETEDGSGGQSGCGEERQIVMVQAHSSKEGRE